MKRERLPSTALSAWAKFNGIKYDGVAIEHRDEGGRGRGFAVIAQRDISPTQEEPLMVIPRALVLSTGAVHAQARYDKHLQELLDVATELSTV